MKQWIVEIGADGQRLDKVLVARSRASRQQVKQWLDAGRVRVNGRSVVIAKWQLRRGDRITLEERPIAEATRERRAARRFVHVWYEDPDLIAIEKLAGMLVVPEPRTTAPTVVDSVRAYLKRRYPGARGTYVRALHRLDQGTSGVVLLAKSRRGEQVIRQFKAHQVGREYVAVVQGAVAQPGGTLRMPLCKGVFGHGRKAAAMPDGKPAITHFVVEERYAEAALLKIRVETGRTHQIRIHLAAIGHPLVGDALYGPPPQTRLLPTGRVALHAARLKFRQPVTGAVVDVRSPMPKDLDALMDRLRGR